jgi:hypothetical protein
MPNCDFYALGADFVRILEFVFEQPGWALVESASRPDRPLRHFDSARSVLAAFDLETEDAMLQLHAASTGGAIGEHRIVYRPQAVAGAGGRTDSEGWGLIQLDLRASPGGPIRPSHTNHNSEARARRWSATLDDRLGPVEAWGWREVERVSGRLNRFMRGYAATRAGSRAVLPVASLAVVAGRALAVND